MILLWECRKCADCHWIEATWEYRRWKRSLKVRPWCSIRNRNKRWSRRTCRRPGLSTSFRWQRQRWRHSWTERGRHAPTSREEWAAVPWPAWRNSTRWRTGSNGRTNSFSPNYHKIAGCCPHVKHPNYFHLSSFQQNDKSDNSRIFRR